jgi:hypothetical protein
VPDWHRHCSPHRSMFHCVRNTGKHINIQFLNTYSYIIRGLRARRRVPRCFLGRLGDGGGEPILRVVRVGFLFIDVLKPTPDPDGGTGFRSIHAGFVVTTFLPDDDIPNLLLHNLRHRILVLALLRRAKTSTSFTSMTATTISRSTV